MRVFHKNTFLFNRPRSVCLSFRSALIGLFNPLVKNQLYSLKVYKRMFSRVHTISFEDWKRIFKEIIIFFFNRVLLLTSRAGKSEIGSNLAII